MRIALDLDGVLVNFTKAACKQMGEPYPSKLVFPSYSWIFDKYGKHSCYKRMRGHHFWTGMEKYPWADRIVDLVDDFAKGKWTFLTKPMRDPYCFSGKAEWIMKNYPMHMDKLTIISGPKKEFVRSRFDILIDDKPENISEWKEAGGSPFYWHEISDDMDQSFVDERLEKLEEHLTACHELCYNDEFLKHHSI